MLSGRIRFQYKLIITLVLFFAFGALAMIPAQGSAKATGGIPVREGMSEDEALDALTQAGFSVAIDSSTQAGLSVVLNVLDDTAVIKVLVRESTWDVSLRAGMSVEKLMDAFAQDGLSAELEMIEGAAVINVQAGGTPFQVGKLTKEISNAFEQSDLSVEIDLINERSTANVSAQGSAKATGHIPLQAGMSEEEALDAFTQAGFSVAITR